MAETNLHSERLADLPLDECSREIQSSIEELRKVLGPDAVRIKSWNKDWVAAALTVNVDLPTRGTVGGIDIRAAEPVIFQFHGTNYPDIAPLAKSDRKDFPCSQLPHLNPRKKDWPAEFCLHRGSLNDWFAEHSIVDYYNRVRAWLRDAASGRLIRDEDQFEPTRLPEARGLCIFDDRFMATIVEKHWATADSSGATPLLSTLLEDASADPTLENTFSMKVEVPWDFDVAASMVDQVRALYRVLIEDTPKLNRPFYGLLLWPKNKPSADYLSSLPETYAELSEFAVEYGLDLEAAMRLFLGLGLNITRGIPIILALLRPQLIIGSSTAFEFLPFLATGATSNQAGEVWIPPSAPVSALSHRRPLTTSFARHLSSVPEEFAGKRLLIVGCGAEGSKIALQLGRAGLPRIRFVDSDSLSPHNLVRHALLPSSLGKNKASALKEQLETIFFADDTKEFTATAGSAYEVMDDVSSFDMVIDATASSSVLESLIRKDLSGPRLVRCEMADLGRLGCLLLEGPDRLPRIDDLQVQLYDLGLDHPVIANWLKHNREEQIRRRGPALEEIDVGLSCSSDTMRLADDVVSYHSAAFSVAIRSILNAPPAAGHIQLNSISVGDGVEGGILTLRVGSPKVLKARGDAGWFVRISAIAYAHLRRHLASHRCSETGGLLVGMIHKKRKTIYVSRVLPPSRDSRGSPYAFRRGVQDYPETLDVVHQNTGGILGYVGEWHTHPSSKAEMSNTDEEAVQQIKDTLAASGIPAHIMIVSPDETNSFVFHSQ